MIDSTFVPSNVPYNIEQVAVICKLSNMLKKYYTPCGIYYYLPL